MMARLESKLYVYQEKMDVWLEEMKYCWKDTTPAKKRRRRIQKRCRQIHKKWNP
jgi:hypothetical protein